MSDAVRRSSPITVDVQLFARYVDLLGTDRLVLELPAGATVGALLDQVRAHPGGDRLPASLLVAVNLIQAARGDPLRDGDEVAVLPPLAGG